MYECWQTNPKIRAIVEPTISNATSKSRAYVNFWADRFQTRLLKQVDELVKHNEVVFSGNEEGSTNGRLMDVVMWQSQLASLKNPKLAEQLPKERYIIQVWDWLKKKTAAHFLEKQYRYRTANLEIE